MSHLDPSVRERILSDVMPQRNGLFYGNCGTGKSYAAAALLFEVQIGYGLTRGSKQWDAGYAWTFDAAWANVPRLMRELKLAMNNKEDRPDPLKKLLHAGIVVIDDLASEYSSGWSAEQIFLVVDYRIDNLMPLIVTTNKTPTELHEADARLASRLMSLPRIPFDGSDRRVK